MNNLTTKIVGLQSLHNLGLNIQFFELLSANIIKNGGATVSIPSGKGPDKDIRYIVSLQGHESKSDKLTLQDITFELLKYVYHKQEVLLREGHYLGAWIEGSNLYLDISTGYIETENAAMILDHLCKARKQKAYFDLKLNKTIYV